MSVLFNSECFHVSKPKHQNFQMPLHRSLFLGPISFLHSLLYGSRAVLYKDQKYCAAVNAQMLLRCLDACDASFRFN